MDIQRTSGVNFGATRVLTASKGFNYFNYSQLAKDCLTYSLLSETQKVSPNTSIVDFQGIGSLTKAYNNKEWLLPADKIAGVKNQIDSKYPNYTFDTSNEEVNLE